MELTLQSAAELFARWGFRYRQLVFESVPYVDTWSTKVLGRSDSHREALKQYENVIELIREADDILRYKHFLSVCAIRSESEVAAFWVTASLSDEEPRLVIWDIQRLLLAGSYQTVYGVDLDALRLKFTVPAPLAGGIQQLVLCNIGEAGALALAVSDTAVRAIRPTGQVAWIADSDEIVMITSVEGDRIHCEPRVKIDEHDQRRWDVSAHSGKVIWSSGTGAAEG